ncbi:hypothetical protein A3F65_00235 [Candidatus Saccharibacteria bacterium RIFCSPHIGHO2_12_FULL_47_16b]|nr:MAG: hypothetical protein A3F65_00235 [Candidatus Saccharibacteria bacterium RIFCSPHIGHO2_12_FULL_47_16b]
MPSSSNLKYLVSVVSLSVLLAAAVIFGGWAYSGRQDYKNNTDKKIAEAVEIAKAAQKQELEAKFAEDSKLPHRTYKGSLTYGGVTFNYPRTWSALIEESSSQPINGYFHPDVLPPLDSKTALALRVELINSEYASVADQYDSQIKDGSLKAVAYIPPQMVNVANVQPGLKLDGQLTSDFSGSMVVIKVRDKTLQLSTQSKDFLKDFNDTVLANLTFVP